jgi:TRAP-type C4-dicarboxylate transport system substrate-binding protein
MTTRLTALAAGLACATLVALSAARAEETTLLFATTNAPNVHVNVRVMHPWAARINEQGKGIVRFDVRDGPTIANFTNYYSRVMDDVVQVTWGLQGLVAGKWNRSLVVALPFLFNSSEEASVAYWRLIKSGIVDSEYEDIVPLFACAFPPVGVHTAKPLKSLDSLAGLKFGVGSKVLSDVVTKLGGTPISLPLTDFYEGLQRGTIDGILGQWTQFEPFKLYEVTTYHVDTELGGAAGVAFMSKKRYNALSPEARKVIDDNSGEAQSRKFGAFWDAVNQEGRSLVQSKGEKHTIVKLTQEQAASWRERTTPVVADWVKGTPDGDKVLAAYRELLAAVQAGK